MLPEQIDAVAGARIRAAFLERALRFERRLRLLGNDAAARGDARGGAFQLAVALVFRQEYRARSRYAWRTWRELTVANGGLKRAIADDLKERLRGNLSTDSDDLEAAWNGHFALQKTHPANPRTVALEEIHAEIDFAIASVDRARERQLWIQVGGNVLAAIAGAILGGFFVMWAARQEPAASDPAPLRTVSAPLTSSGLTIPAATTPAPSPQALDPTPPAVAP